MILYWSLAAFIIAIIAAIFGFGGVVTVAAPFFKVVYFVSGTVFVVTLFLGLKRGPR